MKNSFVKSLRLEYLPGCGVYRIESVLADRITWHEGSCDFILDGIGAVLVETEEGRHNKDDAYFIQRFCDYPENVRCVIGVNESILKPITSFTAAAYGLAPIGNVWHRAMKGREIRFKIPPIVVPFYSKAWKRLILYGNVPLSNGDLDIPASKM